MNGPLRIGGREKTTASRAANVSPCDVLVFTATSDGVTGGSTDEEFVRQSWLTKVLPSTSRFPKQGNERAAEQRLMAGRKRVKAKRQSFAKASGCERLDVIERAYLKDRSTQPRHIRVSRSVPTRSSTGVQARVFHYTTNCHFDCVMQYHLSACRNIFLTVSVNQTLGAII